MSVPGAQPGEGDGDEPVDGGFGRQAAGCCEGEEAVGHELVGRGVVADVAARSGVAYQTQEELAEFLLCSDDLLAAMQLRSQFGVPMPV